MKTLCMSLLVPLLAGCYCNTTLVFRNGTQSNVHVHGALHVSSSETVAGKQVEIAPGKAKEVGGGSHGDLFVTTGTGQELLFTNIDVFVDPKYRKEGNYMFVGAGYIIFEVMLGTNNSLYALMPGKKAVDPTVAQPSGYPKAAREVKERQ